MHLFLGLFTLRIGGAILRKNKHYPGFFFFFRIPRVTIMQITIISSANVPEKNHPSILGGNKVTQRLKTKRACYILFMAVSGHCKFLMNPRRYLFIFFNFYLFYFFLNQCDLLDLIFFLFCAAPLKKKIFFSSYFCLEFCY